jgi:DNA topoisomerase-1
MATSATKTKPASKASAATKTKGGAASKKSTKKAGKKVAKKAGKKSSAKSKKTEELGADDAEGIEIADLELGSVSEDEDDDQEDSGAAGKKAGAKRSSAKGKQLVIVESPAKAKTINKYLGDGFLVRASVGHIRDLPSKSPRGAKQPVPGVDLENDFQPTYEILADKAKNVTDLKREAAVASKIWFATDLDREGEAIAWHLAQVLGIEAKEANRVVFNAITRDEIKRAFSHPRGIDVSVVNAQQARRVLDRIVGYQVSPLLWKKVARGLSAGRVQSVAVRIVVEREREIEAFVPDENWSVSLRLSPELLKIDALREEWTRYLEQRDEKGKGPTNRLKNAWMTEHQALDCNLVEWRGSKFELGCPSDAPEDLSKRAIEVATDCGLVDVSVAVTEDPEGKGPARYIRVLSGRVDPKARYEVTQIESRETSTKPSGPLITSSLQIAASNQLGFSAQRTMRLAQDLYEGVPLGEMGEVGLITYMRTDSTHLSAEAITAIRTYVGQEFGAKYLPDEPLVYASSNKSAQEAHEAIRPTDVSMDPERVRSLLTGPRAEEQYKLYKLIWSRTVGCQMTPAVWNSTAVTLRRVDEDTGVAVRATGRTLVFDGFYRAIGVPTASDEQVLPPLEKGGVMAPFEIAPEQKFTNPPPRYSEASLVKALESEGIGRPSTYASIIQVIQDRNYVEQSDRRFHATDLGEVVTDKLVEAFPELMSVGYTREMEAELDDVEASKADWVAMLKRFYGAFSNALANAHEDMVHAKAELEPAPYKCPNCGSMTCYRFGKNGRFLSCTAYPECNYAAPIDRRGRPLLPERVDVVCPVDGSAMEVRDGRFGKFIASVNYPKTDFVLNVDRKLGLKYPAVAPMLVEDPVCPKCASPLNLRRGKRGPWLGCSKFPKCRGRVSWNSVDEARREELEAALIAHEAAHPLPAIVRFDGRVIPDGTPLTDLAIPGGLATLELHPDAPPPKETN